MWWNIIRLAGPELMLSFRYISIGEDWPPIGWASLCSPPQSSFFKRLHSFIVLLTIYIFLWHQFKVSDGPRGQKPSAVIAGCRSQHILIGFSLQVAFKLDSVFLHSQCERHEKLHSFLHYDVVVKLQVQSGANIHLPPISMQPVWLCHAMMFVQKREKSVR